MKKILLTILFYNLIFLPTFAEEVSTTERAENPELEQMLDYVYEPEEDIYDENDGENDVILNVTPKTKPVKKSKILSEKKLDVTTKSDDRFSPENIYKYDNFNPYESKSTSFTNQKQHGNFTLGTKYDSKIAPESLTQTSTLFTKYQKNKFSFNTSYKSNSFASLDQRGKGTLSFSPEYKLNNRVSVQNIYSTSFLDKNKKSEFVFSLKPFKDDRMDFNIGASQIYSETSTPTRSQLNFSTKFRF